MAGKRIAGRIGGLVLGMLLVSGCAQIPGMGQSAPLGAPGSAPASGPAMAPGSSGQAPAPKATAIAARNPHLAEARIAFDLLDRIYVRCMRADDPVACATFQSSWGEFSPHLRKVLGLPDREDGMTGGGSGDTTGRVPEK